LTGAVLTGAVLTEHVFIPNIDARILAAVEAENARLATIPNLAGDPTSFDMSTWHDGIYTLNDAGLKTTQCGTTHCRAGWAVTLAGEAGKKLEERVGTGTAGAIIYAVSRPGKPVPDFYGGTADALADINACAAADPLPAAA
ncbi:MAG: hypothetical protein ABIT01_13325, partial [Thermoanaerobaculia bacterium]